MTGTDGYDIFLPMVAFGWLCSFLSFFHLLLPISFPVCLKFTCSGPGLFSFCFCLTRGVSLLICIIERALMGNFEF
jgi:hypothetical protein